MPVAAPRSGRPPRGTVDIGAATLRGGVAPTNDVVGVLPSSVPFNNGDIMSTSAPTSIYLIFYVSMAALQRIYLTGMVNSFSECCI